jgi:hypothetical protein
LVFFRLLILLAVALITSCASSSAIPALDASTLEGRWQNRSGGFFRLSWDQCEFFADKRFTCISYPLKGEAVLNYDGVWSLTGNQLQLQLGPDQAYIYYIVETGRDSFTIDSRISGVRTFYRIKDVN